MSKIKIYQKVVSHEPAKRAGKYTATLACGHKEWYILYTKTHPKKLVCRRCSIDEYAKQRDAAK